MPEISAESPLVAVIGGGPAGLMAAEVLAMAGRRVAVFDAKPTVGRKFLLAGVGGMNLTHSEPFESFLSRYGARAPELEPRLRAFGAAELRAWAQGLGIETFVGSSGRVFPTDMKAAPLLRAWLRRLREAGVVFHQRHRWCGWTEGGALRFETPEGEVVQRVAAVVLALGGGSWARLGSDGAWLPWLRERGVEVAPLQAANCGFDVAWSQHFRERSAGEPLKNIAMSCRGADGELLSRQGECVISAEGVEGSLVYALSAFLREEVNARGEALLHMDLLPGRSLEQVKAALAKPRGSKSLSNHLRAQLKIEGVKAGLLRECLAAEDFADVEKLAAGIKALPLHLRAPRPIDEAISSAGGVSFAALDTGFMLKSLPGVFCAGEMLDWEAPTGGYLLTACFATGRAAGLGVQEWLQSQEQ